MEVPPILKNAHSRWTALLNGGELIPYINSKDLGLRPLTLSASGENFAARAFIEQLSLEGIRIPQFFAMRKQIYVPNCSPDSALLQALCNYRQISGQVPFVYHCTYVIRFF